jgi:phage tail-like protein
MTMTAPTPDGSLEQWRGLIDGLVNPRPLAAELPAVFQEDDFCQRLTRAFDDVLAPIFTTIDCWDAYVDAQLVPDDLLEWLASWVGLDVDEMWALDRRRDLVRQATALYRRRGTAGGLSLHVELFSGVAPVIEESGGCSWSTSADTPLPGTPDHQFTVHLDIEDPDHRIEDTVRRIVDASRPGHVAFTLSIGGVPPSTSGTPPSEGTGPGEGTSGDSGAPRTSKTADGSDGGAPNTRASGEAKDLEQPVDDVSDDKEPPQ